MCAAVDNLVKSFRFKLKLEISGAENPGYSLFVEIARRLNVEFEMVEIPAILKQTPWKWLSDRNTKNLRVWIPNMAYREGDFHVFFPFYLNYHLRELKLRDPDFPSPQIDNLYMTLLWQLCYGYSLVFP
ncbi:MAG: hypothetical protein CVT49_16390 [candidate division Zixibacteria bacterium HGW-Zixibacteria-1]|nr:MAG: hypothetical protein CVT49_16390 [candidate division Zixibacteria bacterium HGW-Zixibacteria-1]